MAAALSRRSRCVWRGRRLSAFAVRPTSFPMTGFQSSSPPPVPPFPSRYRRDWAFRPGRRQTYLRLRRQASTSIPMRCLTLQQPNALGVKSKRRIRWQLMRGDAGCRRGPASRTNIRATPMRASKGRPTSTQTRRKFRHSKRGNQAERRGKSTSTKPENRRKHWKFPLFPSSVRKHIGRHWIRTSDFHRVRMAL